MPKLIFEGEGEWYGNRYGMRSYREDQFIKYKYPAEGASKIHMIWTDSPSWITCWNDGNNFIRALKHPDIEFVMCQHPWIENDALFADLLLPVNTKLEEDDIGCDVSSGQMDMLYPRAALHGVAGRELQRLRGRLQDRREAGASRRVHGWHDACRRSSATASTSARCPSTSPGTNGWRKATSWCRLAQDWEDIPAGFYKFWEDPVANPLETPTGKLEFYSTGLAEHFPDDPERPPVPHWIPEGESHQETIGTERSKKYPLLVMSNHPRWGVHSQHDDVTWFREIETCKIRASDGYQYHPLWMNPADAAARGIKHGDVVSIYNERGIVLAGAYVTERIMAGAVGIDHGAKYDPIVPGEIDRGGVINTIVPRNCTSKNTVGMAVSGFLVEVEKTDLDALRNKYPDAFARECHITAGPCIAGISE